MSEVIGMLNSLAMMSHLPLFFISIPTNCRTLYTVLV
jgi:hypothetical protein